MAIFQLTLAGLLLVAPVHMKYNPVAGKYERMGYPSAQIKVAIKDVLTENMYTIVVENQVMYNYLKTITGVDKKSYAEYMERSAIISLDVHDLAKYLAGTKNDKKAWKKFLDKYIVVRTITFDDLGVKNEADFLTTYFDTTPTGWAVKPEAMELIQSPDVVAMLVDLNYDVVIDCFTDRLFLGK